MTILEAMACKCSVISSKTAGGKKLIKDGKNGFLFKTGEADELAKTLKLVMTLPQEKLLEVSKNAYITATNFTYEKRAKEIYEFCKKIFKRA